MSIGYNENDPGASEWLRELMADGQIPEGHVDERSITELKPGDCAETMHFFAGVGGWPYALELAGWDATRPIWTGSCPCQPFSAAGRRKGADDARHLWPAWFRLIRECRPPTIFGEQVANGDGRAWFSAVRADLESVGYAVGCADLCAAGVGAPHIRQRLFWVAYAERDAGESRRIAEEPGSGDEAHGTGTPVEPGRRGGTRGLADAERDDWRANEPGRGPQGRGADGRDSPWSEITWLPCADGKTRPIESGVEPLAHGLPRGVVPSGDPSASEANATGEARKMRLRGYGNAIVPQLAAVFVRAFLDGEPT